MQGHTPRLSNMFRPQFNLCAVFGIQSLIAAFAVLYAAGVIPRFGQWYAVSPYYSQQVDALLKGELALSHDPRDLQYDMAWAEGGVQQVWGLGVPVWRLPFTVAARLAGFPLFPEHIATGLAIGLVTFLLLATNAPKSIHAFTLKQLLPTYGIAGFFICFPPFYNMLCTRFEVYEEAVSHAYLYALAEFCLVFRLAKRRDPASWMVLMLVSGLGPFVRPTLIFYGVAAWIIGSIILCSRSATANHPSPEIRFPAHPPRGHCHEGSGGIPAARALRLRFIGLGMRLVEFGRRYSWLTGTLLFIFGTALLLLTNRVRFGSILEFGHSLNMQDWRESLYFTRFDCPFSEESFPSLLKELAGALFFEKRFNEPIFSAEIFWGQAQSLRMRDVYFTTYNWSYLPLIIGGTGWLILRLGNPPKEDADAHDRGLFFAGWWALAATTGLAAFYLKTPAISSRYLVDFGVAFAVLTLLSLSLLVQVSRSLTERLAISGAVIVWLGWQLMAAQTGGLGSRSLSWSDIERSSLRKGFNPHFGDIHFSGSALAPGNSGIAFDGCGWDGDSKEVTPVITLFVDSPQFLTLELVHTSSAIPEVPVSVRAKIGIEMLRIHRIANKGQSWQITFLGPQQMKYQHGIHPVFVAFVPNTMATEATTGWLLVKVTWRGGTE